ncbi:hypothetical protein [Mesorhizobium sp.]|uniref:hypothetical protein n=1 Tax=Mesorhizobium sp. TaxID=1871066 RepID=UPI00257D8B56|nr:hypothetical protein [Mesorhizobium sp.]
MAVTVDENMPLILGRHVVQAAQCIRRLGPYRHEPFIAALAPQTDLSWRHELQITPQQAGTSLTRAQPT